MATTRVTPIQLLRSILNNKRPDPAKLLSGQVAVNLADTQPGMFLANAAGGLVKIGPCTVGIDPPNSATGWPNPPAAASTGNSLGELWLDTRGSTPISASSIVVGKSYRIDTVGTTNFVIIGASSNDVGVIFTATGVGAGTGTVTDSDVLAPFSILKVWNGSSWINVMPYIYATPIISAAAPTIAGYPDGTMWWDSSTGLMYVLYNDGTTRQWTQVSGSPVQ
jgi:hypothetical protein